MKPWDVLARARTPDGAEMTLVHHPSEYVIRLDGQNLMSSRMHGSEDALATLGCERARALPQPHVLIGGLGMGFTLRAALDTLPATARIIVAELMPAVVEWNRGLLGSLAGHPLDDRRVQIEHGDVAVIMRAHAGRFDAVLLDVDNGPVAMTDSSNTSLYDARGIALCRASLKPRGGVLAVWSAADDRGFERRLHDAGFQTRRERIAGHRGKGPRHTIVVASRDGRGGRP